MKVVFTKRAEKKFHEIISYINVEWGEIAAYAFEEKTAYFLDLLESFPELGVIEVPEKHIRSFQLTKQTRAYYRIKGQKIILLTFFFVRQDPKKKPS